MLEAPIVVCDVANSFWTCGLVVGVDVTGSLGGRLGSCGGDVVAASWLEVEEMNVDVGCEVGEEGAESEGEPLPSMQLELAGGSAHDEHPTG